MIKTALGLKKDKPAIMTHKRLGVQQFEEEFLNYWRELGFRKELDKNSKSYANSIKSLRKVLSDEPPWRGITLSKLRYYCSIFKSYVESNPYRKDDEIKGDLKKLYFHQFVMAYSGFSYLLAIHEGKIKASDFSSEEKTLAEDISKVLTTVLKRPYFSSGEKLRILKFAKNIHHFYTDNAHKIAFGVDIMTIVRGSFSVVTEFRKTKSLDANILIYTGNYAAGAALEQAMEQFGYWKIYKKHEAPDACIHKDPEKTRKVLEKIQKKEDDDLPEIVKRRREELKKNGIEIKKKEQENDCSRRDEFLRKKKERRNPFSK